MTARQRLQRLERIRPQVQAPEPPPTWSSIAAGWRELLALVPDVDPALLARVDRIGERPGPAPGEGPASPALLVLPDPEARRVANEIIGVLSCE